MVTPQYEPFDLEEAPLDEGTALLEASAGTGKTYTITGILVRMVLEDVVEHIEQALVVTFTVAAADELKNRLRAGLERAHAACRGKREDEPFFASLAHHGKAGARKLRRALDEFDQASVTTIHGFCKRLLDEAAFESEEPFDLDFAVDEAPLWHAAAADALRLALEDDGPVLGAVLHRAKLDPEALVRLYRNWQRHPDVALEPAAAHLRVHLDNLRAALHRVAGLWDEQTLERVAALGWLANKRPFVGDGRDYFERATACLPSHPELCLPLLDMLSPSELRSRLLKNSRPDPDEPFFAACEEVHAEWATTLDHLRAELLRRMHERLARHKRDQAVLTFDDLLARAHAATTDPRRRERVVPALRERYRVALIDEFQDTDQRQYEILSTVFSNRPLFLVGDPKQSIYAFRGADLRTYLGAVGDAVQQNTLSRNFRSSRPLVQAVNHLFGRSAAFVEPRIRMPKVVANAGAGDLRVHDDGDPDAALRFRMLSSDERYKNGKLKPRPPEDARRLIASDVTAEIVRLLDGAAKLDGRPVRPRDIAVLTRRNTEAVLVQEQLRAAGVVSVIGKAGDVFETDELVELERILLAVQRPNDLLRARAAMSTRIWGFDAATLAGLEADDARFEQQLERLDRWRQRWLHRGFVVMKEQLLRDLEVPERLLARPDGERRLTNLEQLCEMLHQAEHEHRLSPEGLLHWLEHERSHKDEIDYQRRELRLESDEDAVQILTMHGSKGLQYQIVFCPFLWDGRAAPQEHAVLERASGGDDAPAATPSRRLAFRVERTDPGWLRSEADRLAEDVRLAYVAITRAQRRCYVHWGQIGYHAGGYDRSALAWLLNPANVDVQQAGWQQQWIEDFREGSESLTGAVQRLAEKTQGAVSITEVGAAPPARRRAAADGDPADDARRAAPSERRRRAPRVPQRQPLVVHSFSSLVAGGAAGDLAVDADAHDVRDPAEDGSDERGEGIFGFARGAEAGQCLHTILEHVDLQDPTGRAVRDVVERTLRLHGLLEADAHPGATTPVDDVVQNLRDLAAARVHDGGPTVAELCAGPRAVEWQFTLPVATPDLPALAAAFEAAQSPVANAYAQRLRHLPTQRFAGFLTGFADLIASHEGRYWVVDWKSNHLGNRRDDYGRPALDAAMRGHDYVLQYHLYVLAWHRHLRNRLADYDYDAHFGGVCYAFLRGAAPDATTGMFYDRPPRDLVEALDGWARGGAR